MCLPRWSPLPPPSARQTRWFHRVQEAGEHGGAHPAHLDPETGCPNFFSLKANYKIVEDMIEEGMVASACSVGYGGIAEALFKMGLGNHIGFKMRADMTTHRDVRAHVRLHRAGNGVRFARR